MSSLSRASAKARLVQLRELIAQERYNVHVLDRSRLSESALDSLKHELFELEQAYPDFITPDSPTQRVAGKPLPAFKKAPHTTPMLSMEDVFSEEEFEAWVARVERFAKKKIEPFFYMPKADGLAVSLLYEGGQFTRAATRGDGQIGEDVTHTVKTVESVPLSIRVPPAEELREWMRMYRVTESPHEIIERLAGTLELRGELYIPKKAFDRLNRERKKNGEPLFANPRNLAAGSVRQLDPSIAAARPLAFLAWRLQSDLRQGSQAAGMALLHLLGFPVVPGGLVKKTSEVLGVYERLLRQREKSPFWMDGMVVRVNDDNLFASLGVVGKTPRGIVAWKFPAEEVTTVVEEVEWFVGRTGALTPVAVLRPVSLAGTTVTHASLHNMDEITRLDVRVGDTVILFKAGDIIPKVKEVLVDLRPRGASVISAPKRCPACGAPVERKKGIVAFTCSNQACFAKQQEELLHLVRAFEIEGIGPQTLHALMDAKLVADPSDLFLLREGDFLTLEGFAEVSARKAVDAIAQKRRIPLHRFLMALSIPGVGEETARDLAKAFSTLPAFLRASGEELLSIFGIGDILAQDISAFLADPTTRLHIQKFLDRGVIVEEVSVSRVSSQHLFSGKTVVLTGTLSQMSRKEAEDTLRSLGAQVGSSVSRKTSFVVVGESPGSKAEEAERLSIPILSEQEFLDRVKSET